MIFSSTNKTAKNGLMGIANAIAELSDLDNSQAESTLNAIKSIAGDSGKPLDVRKAAVKSFAKICRHLQSGEHLIDSMLDIVREDKELAEATVRPVNQLVKLAASLRDESTTDTVRSMDTVPASPAPLTSDCIQLVTELAGQRKRFAKKVEQLLSKYEGYRPESLEEGVQVVKTINATLAALGVALVEPKSGQEATLMYRQIGGAKPGAFVFRMGAETAYGGVVLPSISVVVSEKFENQEN